MISLVALLLAQALTPDELALEKDLLAEARRALAARDDAARTALAERGEAEEYYYRCLRARIVGSHGGDCGPDFQAVRRRAIAAEVALMGVKFDRRSVEKYLDQVRVAGAKIVLTQN